MDYPLSNQFIGLNRWKYIGTNGLMFQTGIKSTTIRNVAGQLTFEPAIHQTANDPWGMEFNVDRIEGWAKLGKVFLGILWRSFGIQVSGSNHRQQSRFGLNDYPATQQSLYGAFFYSQS